MKKRIVTALLAGVMALSLAACGGSSSDAGQSTSQAQTEESGSGSSQAASGEKNSHASDCGCACHCDCEEAVENVTENADKAAEISSDELLAKSYAAAGNAAKPATEITEEL